MTATYDGRLLVRDKKIQPCCDIMHAMSVRTLFSVNTKGEIVIRYDDRKTIKISCCPFCGAEVM